mmetsp:Transcript_2922/g.7049  ORF Transcript_2922/g.7049 Transcript_2922/m.7049 type:complete len:231 (+) Transcript_2922:1563-2255(+)
MLPTVGARTMRENPTRRVCTKRLRLRSGRRATTHSTPRSCQSQKKQPSRFQRWRQTTQMASGQAKRNPPQLRQRMRTTSSCPVQTIRRRTRLEKIRKVDWTQTRSRRSSRTTVLTKVLRMLFSRLPQRTQPTSSVRARSKTCGTHPQSLWLVCGRLLGDPGKVALQGGSDTILLIWILAETVTRAAEAMVTMMVVMVVIGRPEMQVAMSQATTSNSSFRRMVSMTGLLLW